eukprot:GHRR01031354.1.p1 GENE.GHRR01031354.1~~GHRR01031354.1.p1  ORF type:complete len:118 (+),score=9.42 GHRR01031354.1:196-549(+)
MLTLLVNIRSICIGHPHAKAYHRCHWAPNNVGTVLLPELCAGVTLNTHPPTHTSNMFSWFPIFFPLREPMMLPAGADVVAHMWRGCGKHKVWYEWAVSEPAITPIHNPSGRSYWVGL